MTTHKKDPNVNRVQRENRKVVSERVNDPSADAKDRRTLARVARHISSPNKR